MLQQVAKSDRFYTTLLGTVGISTAMCQQHSSTPLVIFAGRIYAIVNLTFPQLFRPLIYQTYHCINY